MSALLIDREYHRICYHILFLPRWNPSDSFMLKRRITLATLEMAEGVFVICARQRRLSQGDGHVLLVVNTVQPVYNADYQEQGKYVLDARLL